MDVHVEVELTAKGKTISRFRADGVQFWDDVMIEVSEEELKTYVPDFKTLPAQITYVDPEFIETMWEICVHYGHVSQDYDTLETAADLLKINTRT